MEKSKNPALASFILGLFFWVPLFNYVLAPLAMYLGIAALLKIKKHPEKYEGKAYAVIGIILASTTMFSWLVWLLMKILGIDI